MKKNTRMKTSVNWIFILILICLASITDNVFAQTYPLQGAPYIKNYTTAEMVDGGPQIWCIAQDNRGMVYVGDCSGIIEFNGREWRFIQNSNNSIVRAMAADSLGVVYVGASGDFGYLQPNLKGEMEFVSLTQPVVDQSIKFRDIWKVIPTSHGVYFFSNKYIFKYYKKRVSVISVDFKVQDAYLLNNQLYLPTKKGLCLLNDSTIIELTPKSFFLITPFDDDKALSVYSGTGKLGFLNLATLEFSELETPLANYFESHSIVNLIKIDDEKIALATANGEIVVMSKSGELIQLIDKNKGLMSGAIYRLYVDNDKNLWAGMSKGLAKIDINFPVSMFGEGQNVPDGAQTSCVFNGKRYIATTEGIYYLPDFDYDKIEEGDKFVKIKNIGEDECWDFKVLNNRLFAIGSTGIWAIDNTEAKNIFPIEVPQKAHCFNTTPLFPDRVFIGMRGKLVAVKMKTSPASGQVTVTDEIDFPEIDEKIRRITPDKEGNLWLNTQFDGVYFVRFIDGDIHNYRVTLLGKQNGLPNLDYTHTYTVNNEITITTAAGILQPVFPIEKNASDSLIRFEPTMLFGDTLNDAYAVVAPVSENRYLIASTGLRYATINGTKQAYDSCGFWRMSFGIADISVDRDSVISISSPDGFFKYDLTNHRNFNKPFNTIISQVELNGDSIVFSGSYFHWVDSTKVVSLTQTPEFIPTFDYKYNSLTFHFSALFYEDPEVTEFQYQLLGFDKKWSNSSIENKAVYTNLPHGIYTFKVRAKNAYWKMGNVVEYKFTIKAPWYKTWWAYIFYVLLFAATVYFAMRIYAKTLRKQKEYLELVVEERTGEIIEQASELKAINEKLMEMDKFKQGVTSMIVHDLKNPINAIINSGNVNPENQLIRVKQTGRQMLNLVLNILDVSKYEETNIPLNFENNNLLNLSQRAIEQVLFLSNEKNIAIGNHIKPELGIRADAEIVERVFVNILTNAIKYTPNNGLIVLNASPDSIEANKLLKVTISDNGMGIPADKIDLVFQKFGQVIAKNSGSVRSTGLGLTYCKMVIEAHGGNIGVESNVDHGSIFWFTIPQSTEITVYHSALIGTENIQPIELSEINRRLIRKQLDELQITEFYKITEILAIIETIDDLMNAEIKAWKQALITAIDSGNESLYKQLL